MSTDKKDEIKQLIIQMLLVNGEVYFDDMFHFFKNTDKMKHIGQSVFFLEEEGIVTIRIDDNHVYISLVDD